MSYKGGYYLINEPLIKSGIHRHTADLPDPIPQAQLDALNRIGETPWKLNAPIVAILEEAMQSGDHLPALPRMDDVPLPGKLEDDTWEAMTKAEKAEVKAERERVHSINAKAYGQRESLLRKVSLMRDLRGRTFWYPHAVDWRGRAYAIPQDLNPQADDVARGCLTFAEGRPLGKSGAYHLALRGASMFGMDKVSLDERVQWFADNERLVIDSATNPLDGERWWCEADEPWQFLATCIDWVGWLNDGGAHVCHLPIPYDATCSGLQHLSAMGLSADGGRRVNLTSDPHRHDVYQVVADEVCRIIQRDAEEGNELARNWQGHVERGTVKRQVMTICYGATRMGMRKMAINDGHTDGLEGNRVTNAAYLTDVILDAITDVLSEAKRIMDWMQESASIVAESDNPVVFTTPIGMTVKQAYLRRSKKRVCTLFGEAVLWESDTALGYDTSRMRQGIVPNVIHSYDAAHLYATINSSVERSGGELSWAVVHDSFATWAGEPSRVMNQVLREEFYRIYETDQLAHLYEAFAASGANVPTPPTRGSLDISEVLRSEYFFS